MVVYARIAGVERREGGVLLVLRLRSGLLTRELRRE
jgi:hypothetical protein